ncbi:MAG: beta-ketoacyl-ACP synthase [Sandaracinaceae bacterium]
MSTSGVGSAKPPHRVVITGIGVTTPIGNDVASSVQGLKEGRSGARFMPDWDDIEDLHCKVAACVDGLDLETIFPRKRRRTMGRVALLAVHATEQAVDQSGLDRESLRSERVGVVYGSTTGSSEALEKYSTRMTQQRTLTGLDPNAYFKLMTHTCAVNVAQFYGVMGRIASTCTACTSSSQAIGTAYELVRSGTQDIVLCGGAEEMHYTSACTFDLLMATSYGYNDRPTETPRPFDKARDGLICGEGAGALVLETLEGAKRRGATILAEVLGYATNCDGAHISAPHQAGMRRVMELALADAGLEPSAVDYVCGHGTGTEVGDIAESQATRDVFDRRVPMASLKGYVGHTLGACGAIEAAWSVEMIRTGFLAANRNLTEVDPRCGDLDYVMETREARPSVIMTNNFAFGGINTSILLGRPE